MIPVFEWMLWLMQPPPTLWGFYRGIYCSPEVGAWPQLLISQYGTRDQGRALEFHSDCDPCGALAPSRVKIRTEPPQEEKDEGQNQVTEVKFHLREKAATFQCYGGGGSFLRGKKKIPRGDDFWYVWEARAAFSSEVGCSLLGERPCSAHYTNRGASCLLDKAGTLWLKSFLDPLMHLRKRFCAEARLSIHWNTWIWRPKNFKSSFIWAPRGAFHLAIFCVLCCPCQSESALFLRDFFFLSCISYLQVSPIKA